MSTTPTPRSGTEQLSGSEIAPAVPCSAFIPEDRRFYWWRCGPDGHWLIVMVRNGLCLMPGFSQAHKVADQKGEFWPVPIDPPSWPNDEMRDGERKATSNTTDQL